MRNLHDIYQIRGDHHTQGRHQEYAKLIEALPASTFEYYSMCDQSVIWNRFWFLMKQCDHHKGEVVQITHHANYWQLTEGPCPLPSVPAQFRCDRDWQVASLGAATTGCLSTADREKHQQENGRTDGNYIKNEAEAQDFLEAHKGYADGVWMDGGIAGSSHVAHSGTCCLPDWDNQKYLCVVPCKASHDWHWLRQTLCSTLGQMFKVLGKEHTAFDIYQFYMTRKIVVRKVETRERRRAYRRPLAPDEATTLNRLD